MQITRAINIPDELVTPRSPGVGWRILGIAQLCSVLLFLALTRPVPVTTESPRARPGDEAWQMALAWLLAEELGIAERSWAAGASS